MRLKKLEIKGFKSFAKPTVIHFSENVTGIVGPNGSGKSNVVDAIRWVLGEQKSKDLRLERMSDVLFNGSKTRKRTGMAQVTMTFENNKGLLPLEYSEVSISRILYRSGQSEYRLNDVSCRLKDIQQLLSNTGIGSNSYAIIELGMVNDILQDKNDSRRRMFEQAADIHSFKRSKHETELKLKATNEDLERVDDLLHEIKQNMRQLERQAKKAEKYLQLKAKYKAQSILHAAHSLNQYKDQYTRLKEAIQQSQEEFTHITAELNSVTAQLQKKKSVMQENELLLTTKQQAYSKIKSDVQQILNEIELHKRDIDNLSSNLNQYQTKQQSDAARILELKNDRAKLEGEINQLHIDVERSTVERDEVKVKREELAAKMNDLESVKKELLSQQQSLRDKITESERINAIESNRIESLQILTSQHQEEWENVQARLQAMQEQRGQIMEQSDQYAAQLQVLERNHLEASDRLIELTGRIAKIEDEYTQARVRREARQNEHDLLKNMIENLEGYPDSIKFLAKEYQWQHPTVLLSEIISCEPTYRNAIEAYLEPWLNHYVVADDTEAIRAIEVLKDGQRGRAEFMNASAFVNKSETHTIAREEGLIPALDVIEYHESYAALLSTLLQDVYIDMSSEIDTRDLPETITVIAQDGHLIRSSKYISGGSIGLFDGLKLGRTKTLDKLTEAIDQLELAITNYEKQLEALKDEKNHSPVEQLKSELENVRRAYSISDTEQRNLSARIKEAEDTLVQLEDKKSEKLIQIERSTKLIDEKTVLLKQLKDEYDRHSSKLSGESGLLDELSQQLNALNQQWSDKNIAHIRLQGELERLQQQAEMIDRRVDEVQNDISSDAKKQSQDQIRLTEHQSSLNKLQQTAEQQQKEAQELRLQLTEFEESYFNEKNEILTHEKSIRELNNHRESRNDHINQMKDEYSELRIKINEISQRVKVEFEVESGELMNMELAENFDLENAEQEVQRMRGQLFNFGEVNPLAVEAFEEMKSRHDGIAEQRQDILDAQVSLQETIRELEEKANDKFLTAFDVIKVHFKDIFRSFFNGEDDCDLILLNPDEPLNSPIDIIAKPKGKRPLSLSQLSGGETTLTATALLFALYLLKPAPVCIFDEVDAPLDDINIQKFNQIIQRFSQGSQFVVITHNKLTMAAVDVIYGVYMDEPGVSGVTPVDFRELTHDPVEMVLSEN